MCGCLMSDCVTVDDNHGMNVIHFAQLDKDTILLCAESESTTFIYLLSTTPYLTLPYLRGGQVVTPAQR